ncbi:MAG: integrase core domain-containing protein [Casimicrobiaceae bacterium]
MLRLAGAIVGIISDLLRLLALFVRSSGAIRAENLVLRRQLARYLERGIKPRRVDYATRVSLALFSRLFDWRHAVVIVRPSTIVRWHRLGWRIFWRWKSRAGRPRIPPELRSLIRRMASENPLWGEERIANELMVKLGIRLSPRTVRKYMPPTRPGVPRGDQHWLTFLNNHAKAIIACDFFVAVTATFRMLYVFVVIEHGTRRWAHVNVTAHPTADWTLQQLREAVTEDGAHPYLIHDRDGIFSKHLDDSIEALGLEVLRSPATSPKANSICERVIGSIRRECLDWMIPMSEAHLRTLLNEWVTHYNGGRPHSALGPGVPDPPQPTTPFPKSKSRHRLAAGAFVRVKSLLGGLHHEYSLATTPRSA